MRWDRGDEGVVGGDDVDDDPDGAQCDDDSDDFPLWEGISPVDFCLSDSFLLSVSFPPRDGGGKII